MSECTHPLKLAAGEQHCSGSPERRGNSQYARPGGRESVPGGTTRSGGNAAPRRRGKRWAQQRLVGAVGGAVPAPGGTHPRTRRRCILVFPHPTRRRHHRRGSHHGPRVGRRHRAAFGVRHQPGGHRRRFVTVAGRLHPGRGLPHHHDQQRHLGGHQRDPLRRLQRARSRPDGPAGDHHHPGDLHLHGPHRDLHRPHPGRRPGLDGHHHRGRQRGVLHRLLRYRHASPAPRAPPSPPRPSTSATANPALPAGFTQTKLAGGLAKPIVLDFAPNGDLYVGEQAGKIVIYRNGAVQPTPVLSMTVFQQGETGLLGHGPRPQLRHQRLSLRLLHGRPHHLGGTEPALRPPVPLHRGRRGGQPGQREGPLHRQPGPARGRYRRQLRPRRQRSEGRTRRQAVVERGRQRPLHQQRGEPLQHLREDPPLQPRRYRPLRQPLRQRGRGRARTSTPTASATPGGSPSCPTARP